VSTKNITGLVFSKDRAMQLDGTLRSFFLHCKDADNIDISVLYTTSDWVHKRQYQKLAACYPEVNFVEETSFKQQVLECIKPYEYVLFLVDDILFTRDFSVSEMVGHLDTNDDSLGFSLRLGMNTTYCYMLYRVQKLPAFTSIDEDTLKFRWTEAEYDFNYPLEVSMSIYRLEDIYPLLENLAFTNPNSMEYVMSCSAYNFGSSRPHLLCKRNSLAFGYPVNIVQTFYTANRFGNEYRYSIKELAELFDMGYRIDVKKYNMLDTNSICYEVKLKFVQV
jgi:hypothetical protein